MGAEDNAHEAADAAARLQAWFKAEGPLVMDEADFDDVQTVLGDYARLRAQLAEVATLLGHFVDHEDQPCRLDHHGGCQEHGGSSLRRCDVAAGRELLARLRGGDGVLAAGCPVHDPDAKEGGDD